MLLLLGKRLHEEEVIRAEKVLLLCYLKLNCSNQIIQWREEIRADLRMEIPPEVNPSDSTNAKVKVRFPDGTQQLRWFSPSCTIRVCCNSSTSYFSLCCCLYLVLYSNKSDIHSFIQQLKAFIGSNPSVVNPRSFVIKLANTFPPIEVDFPESSKTLKEMKFPLFSILYVENKVCYC